MRVSELPAGRVMDALVSDKVLGEGRDASDRFSSCLVAALDALETFVECARRSRPFVRIYRCTPRSPWPRNRRHRHWRVIVTMRRRRCVGTGFTLPAAICRALLAASKVTALSNAELEV